MILTKDTVDNAPEVITIAGIRMTEQLFLDGELLLSSKGVKLDWGAVDLDGCKALAEELLIKAGFSADEATIKQLTEWVTTLPKHTFQMRVHLRKILRALLCVEEVDVRATALCVPEPVTIMPEVKGAHYVGRQELTIPK